MLLLFGGFFGAQLLAGMRTAWRCCTCCLRPPHPQGECCSTAAAIYFNSCTLLIAPPDTLSSGFLRDLIRRWRGSCGAVGAVGAVVAAAAAVAVDLTSAYFAFARRKLVNKLRAASPALTRRLGHDVEIPRTVQVAERQARPPARRATRQLQHTTSPCCTTTGRRGNEHDVVLYPVGETRKAHC